MIKSLRHLMGRIARLLHLPSLGRVDRYIIRTFLNTFFFSIILIISVSVVFDMNERMSDLLRPEVSLYEIVFHYYLNFIPYYANLFSPLFVFISVIFFTSKLAENSEIIAMMASGMSFRRMLLPYFVAASVIAGLSFVLNNFIIPPGNKVRIDFENKYFRNKNVMYASGVQLEVEPNVVLFMNAFYRENKTGTGFSLDSYEGRELRSRLTARAAIYDTLYRWSLQEYRIRYFDGHTERDSVGLSLDTIIRVNPEDFLISAKDVEKMTSPELSRYIDKQSSRGVGDVKLFAIELHKRYAAIFSAFILTFIGAVLSAKKMKNGLGFNIAIGLGLSFSYILFSEAAATFAISGSMSPWLAAWLPNFAFVVIALGLWPKAPR